MPTADPPIPAPNATADDPDLKALPIPRRPWKRFTLGSLALTAGLAAVLAFALRGEAAYSLRSGAPTDVGSLSDLRPSLAQSNTWVRGEAALSVLGAVRYSRPLESDSFRLAPVAGNPALWVEVRVPAGLEGPHFVPPNSFVGRLVPLAKAGLRYSSLANAVAEVGGVTVPNDVWLLVDGEPPASARWALGLVALFAGFSAFSVYGLYRLLRPVS